MKHNYLDNKPLDEARSLFIGETEKIGFFAKTEKVKTQSAFGRITAKPVYALMCSPHYNASAMDGVAVKASDTFGATENRPLTIYSDKYVTVDTGDALPENTDAVIMVEDISENPDGSITILAPVSPWQNVRQVGEDICMGDMIATSGCEITPALCGAFLAGGVTEVEVKKIPLFGIIPTGDEIVSPDMDLLPGQIPEFNSTVFSGMLKQYGAQSRVYPITPDKKELLSEMLIRAKTECDAVLILAGSSAGRDDYTCETVNRNGRVLVHGIAVKPGKPAVLGILDECTPVIGLPGYPVSAIVIMEQIVHPLIKSYYRCETSADEFADAVLGKRIVSSLKYEEFVRVTLGMTGDRLTAVPLPRGAGVITSFTKASGIIDVPQNSEGYEAGQTVKVRLLKNREELSEAVIVTGSHDPLIDEINNLMKEKGCPYTVSSSHVGSMGAITAVKTGQAHLGGIHLIDSDGVYNESYVKKYFPEGGAVLVKGVGRIQGLMVKKGNPLGIRKFSDIKNCTYVNRQRGSGTRLLCDLLMKENAIAPEEVRGYDNEEFTHTAVAALISAGNGDTGLGIFSAAQMYGLDFIPVCDEEYDFLISEKYIDSPKVRAFLEILHSDELRARLTEMGGYTLRD